jgi:hypothetical protein
VSAAEPSAEAEFQSRTPISQDERIGRYRAEAALPAVASDSRIAAQTARRGGRVWLRVRTSVSIAMMVAAAGRLCSSATSPNESPGFNDGGGSRVGVWSPVSGLRNPCAFLLGDGPGNNLKGVPCAHALPKRVSGCNNLGTCSVPLWRTMGYRWSSYTLCEPAIADQRMRGRGERTDVTR